MGHLSADKAVICRSIMNLQIRRYRTFFADIKSADILADYLPIFSADINIGRSLPTLPYSGRHLHMDGAEYGW